ncbi:MAG: shikimate kinase [Clostridia bacterium]|nr:shikimate kinase [Clostridia bacterium]
MTARYGLLGRSLSHSLSPQIHAAFGEYPYDLIEKPEEALAEFFANPPYAAINVTIPYKKAVVPYCTELDDVARRIGSVNTIRFDKDAVRGYNTDYVGFTYMLERADITVSGKKVLVLGNGGASATVQCALEDLKAAEVVVISRSGENHYGNLDRHADAQVIINTTPVGMFPETAAAPLSLTHFPRCEAVADLIYNPLRTRLLAEAESRGLKTANGLAMLAAQGHRAAEIFLDKPLDKGLIEECLRRLEKQFRNIVLVGMPGCGKSTQAHLLARALGRNAVDTDEYVEQSVGKPIPQIFEEMGEAAFRTYEAQAVQELCKGSGNVIATGGGAILTAENRTALRQNGVVVFLEREIEKLARAGRPLSRDEEAVRQLYAKRLPLYREAADVTVTVSRKPEETCARILEAIGYEDNHH